MRRFLSGLIAAFCLAPSAAQAEYRAYRIAIRDETTGKERMVVSSLDPIQYSGYYPLKRNESTRLASTWRCRARSDWFAPACPEPSAPRAKSK